MLSINIYIYFVKAKLIIYIFINLTILIIFLIIILYLRLILHTIFFCNKKVTPQNGDYPWSLLYIYYIIMSIKILLL